MVVFRLELLCRCLFAIRLAHVPTPRITRIVTVELTGRWQFETDGVCIDQCNDLLHPNRYSDARVLADAGQLVAADVTNGSGVLTVVSQELLQ